jgi:1-deoxy-D-xylulose-5-phosphate reductoisomerase
VLNAANEVAVHAFLGDRLDFMGIPAVIERTLEALPAKRVHSFDTLYAADAEARRIAAVQVGVRGRPGADRSHEHAGLDAPRR